MEFRKIFLYNVLPKKRIIIALIGFLISSTIITGAGILMSSIIDSTSSYLGESDSILVISNPDASTPYTSILPLDLTETIISLDGVIEVSPEVMTAAVYKNKAVYFRGVDTSKFWQFTEIIHYEGVLPSVNDTFEVSIGENFASRNNLKIGDFITLFSTRSDSAIELRIKSIFYTGTLLDDEIVASLWVGQFFAFETFDYVTHIRTRIDLGIISDKEMLRELVTSEYTLSTNIATPDSMQEVNATVYIRNRRGDLVNETVIFNDDRAVFRLPFGEYEVQGEIEGVLSETQNILLHQDTVLDLFVPYIEKEVFFRIITDENEPIFGAKISITSQKEEERFLETRTYSRYTDINGEASFTISNGSYVAEISKGIYRKVVVFDTISNSTNEIILISRHPLIYVHNPLNFSTIIGQELNVSITATNGYSIYFYFDDNIASIQEYYSASPGEIYPEKMIAQLEEGFHSITIEAFNDDYITSGQNKSLNYATTKTYFYLKNDFHLESIFLNVMNGSHINPGGILIFNTSIIFNDDVYFRWNNNDWQILENAFVTSPLEIGIHKFALLSKIDDQYREWSFVFIISNSANKVGIMGLANHMTYKVGDTFQSWFNPYFEVYYHWDSNSSTLIQPNGMIDVPALSEGNHTLYLSTYIDTQWYNRTYDVSIDNTPPQIFLSVLNGTTIDANTTISVTTDEDISFLEYSWDSIDFSKTYLREILVPELEGNHTLMVKVSDLAGNIFSYYFEFIVTNFMGSDPIDFYLSNEYSGVISSKFIDLEVYSYNSSYKIVYNIEGQISKSGYLTDSKRIYLYAGNYTLTITYWTNSIIKRERSWNFRIESGFNFSDISITDINQTIQGESNWEIKYFEANFTQSNTSSIFLCDGLYFLQYQLLSNNLTFQTSFFIDTLEPYLNVITPNLGEEESTTPLVLETDAVQVLVRFSTDSQYQVYSDDSWLPSLQGEHTLVFLLNDSFYNQVEIRYTFQMGLPVEPQNLTFEIKVFDMILPVSGLEVSINSIYNDTTKVLFSNLDGIISFSILKGEYIVSFIYNEILIELSLDSSLSFNQTIFVGGGTSVLEVRDYYANSTISQQYCIIRDSNGRRVFSQHTNSVGKINVNFLAAGDYMCYFTSGYTVTAAIPFEIYKPSNHILFKIPSRKEKVIFKFQYDNGTQIFNLPVIITTTIEGTIYTTTALSSQITLYISYGTVNLTIMQKDGGILNLRRVFEPGKNTILIVLPSYTEEQWSKIPFKPIAGFTFLISISSEYFDYYLKGSLLFTYTLAYAEILLILIVVIVNMYSILQNMYKESRRETTIIRMIGGTNIHSILTIFSRLGVVAFIASIIGYGFGTLVLEILSSLNQTVFFGHTFVPKGSWEIFLLNVGLILLIAIITTLLIARKSRHDKTVTQVRR